MAFQVSPGVLVKEIDLTNVIPAVSTSIGAIAGAFRWGPVGEIRTIGSEKDLANVYGSPDDYTYKYFLPAGQFLKYGNALRVVRAETSGMQNSVSYSTKEITENFTGDGTDTFTLVEWTVASVVSVSVNSVATQNYSVSGNDVQFTTPPGSGDPISITYSTNVYLDDVKITNEEDYDTTSKTDAGDWIGKYPGSLGNSLKVVVASDSTSYNHSNFSGYKNLFTGAPGTSDWVSNKGGSDDEIHIVVVDEDGYWTGEAGTVLETFGFVSLANDAKSEDGTNNYYVNVVNNTSSYIWFGNHNTNLTNAGSDSTTTFVTSNTVLQTSLQNGVDDHSVSVSNLQNAYNLFSDSETVDVSLVIGGESPTGTDGVTFANFLIALATTRKDCIAFVSPRIEDTVGTLTPATDVITFADSLTSSSYGVLDSTALYVYDKYNDKYRWIAASGAVAGLCANTDNVADAWFSPAGLNRGQLLGVTKLAFNPKKADRDDLYLSRVNPIVSFPGEGTVLFGDKTLLSKPSAFDRINVRRLFIVLEKAISTASKFQLFEFNDEFTRAQFRNLVEPFLRDVKGRRGVTDFLVVCDATNNTGQVIDTNQFVADIYIKPARSINFITLNFIATRTGVDFSEIVGQ